ncbi:deoxyribonucleotide triphosphate pyrophosphatase [Escherichia coli]|nr:deoxyribonucleotide triphosphate pyrophosphatase [Escherichia coli]
MSVKCVSWRRCLATSVLISWPKQTSALIPLKKPALTFIENAILKARHAAKVTALPAIADDSGLAVDVLGGAPGIYSARYSGEDATDQKNLQKLLETMKDVPDDQRQARFPLACWYICVTRKIPLRWYATVAGRA